MSGKPSFDKFIDDYLEILSEYDKVTFGDACYRFVLSWSESLKFDTIELVNYFNAADELILKSIPGLSLAEQRKYLLVFLKVREKIIPQLQVSKFAHSHISTRTSAGKGSGDARKAKAKKWQDRFLTFYKQYKKKHERFDNTESDRKIIMIFIKRNRTAPKSTQPYYALIKNSF